MPLCFFTHNYPPELWSHEPKYQQDALGISTEPYCRLYSCYHTWYTTNKSKITRHKERWSNITPQSCSNLKSLILPGTLSTWIYHSSSHRALVRSMHSAEPIASSLSWDTHRACLERVAVIIVLVEWLDHFVAQLAVAEISGVWRVKPVELTLVNKNSSRYI